MAIGEKIKALRKSLGITQQQLGGNEFTKGYISQIEKGTVTPSMKVLNLIARRLSKPVAYFLEGEDDYSKLIEEKYIRAENLYLKQDYNNSINAFQDILTKSSNKGSVIYTNSMLYHGKCLYFLGNYEKGVETLTDAIHQLIRLSSIEKLVDAYLYKGLCLFDHNYPLAIDAFQRGLQIIDGNALTLHNLKAKLQLNISTGYLNLGRLSIALQGFENGISFCKKEQINDTLLDCYVRSGYVHYLLGNIQPSKERILNANSINVALDNDMVWTEIYALLGMIVFKEGRHKQALTLIDKSIDICKRIDYDWGHFINIIEKISMLIELQQLAEAELLINAYYDDIDGLADRHVFNRLLILQGRLEKKLGRYRKSIEYYSTAIDNFIILKRPWEIYSYAKELADLLVEENSALAKKYYSLSFEGYSQITSLLP